MKSVRAVTRAEVLRQHPRRDQFLAARVRLHARPGRLRRLDSDHGRQGPRPRRFPCLFAVPGPVGPVGESPRGATRGRCVGQCQAQRSGSGARRARPRRSAAPPVRQLLRRPALSMDEYATYHQDVIVGASLQVTAPLGQYDSTKLLNVGTNRWSIKPELGVSKAWGPVTLEVIPAITFFTNNDDFLRGKTLEQDPIYSVQGHLIYEISPALWTAFDATYYTGGRTTIDGEKGERLENVRLGLTTSLSLTRHQSTKLFGSAGVYHRTENNFWAVGLAWQYRWGGGL